MNINVDISNDAIQKYTENVISVSGIKGISENSPITCNSVLKKSQVRASEILKIIALGKTGVPVVREYTTQNAHYYRIVMENNANTASIFTTFAKLGILATGCCVDITESRTSVKLPLTIMKAVRTLSTEAAQMFVMYIISVCHIIITAYENGYDYTYDAVTQEVNCNRCKFTEHLYPFCTNMTVTVSDLQFEDVLKISKKETVSGGSYSLKNIVKVDMPTLSLIKVEKENSEDYILRVHQNGSLTGDPLILFKPETSKAVLVTTYPLSTIELSTDSFFEYSILNTPSTADIEIETVKCHGQNSIKTPVNCTIENWDLDTNSISDDTIRKIITQCTHYGNFEDAPAELIKSLTKLYEDIGEPINLQKNTLASGSSKASEYTNDAYAQQLYTQAQPYFDNFELGNLAKMLPGFLNGNIYSMMFTGASGTGKSTAARVIPYKCGIPYVSINFSVNIEESDIFGTMIPNPKKTTVDDPEFVWKDGVLTTAIRNGYCAVLEEINFARPGVLGKLNSLLDETRQIDLPNGELLKAHPNFRLIATCNIMYEGTNRFNKALINRFETCILFNEPDKSEVVKIIQDRTGYKDATKIETIYCAYNALKKFSDAQNLDLVVSLRQLLTLFKQGKYYVNAEEAFMNIIVNSAFIENEEYRKEFLDTVLHNFSLKFKI